MLRTELSECITIAILGGYLTCGQVRSFVTFFCNRLGPHLCKTGCLKGFNLIALSSMENCFNARAFVFERIYFDVTVELLSLKEVV